MSASARMHSSSGLDSNLIYRNYHIRLINISSDIIQLAAWYSKTTTVHIYLGLEDDTGT